MAPRGAGLRVSSGEDGPSSGWGGPDVALLRAGTGAGCRLQFWEWGRLGHRPQQLTSGLGSRAALACGVSSGGTGWTGG